MFVPMEKDIANFIDKRFPESGRWVNGNCYFFAVILKDVFGGDIVYDPIDGHFLLQFRNGDLYDYTGKVDLPEKQLNALVDWDTYAFVDPLHYSRIVRDCIF